MGRTLAEKVWDDHVVARNEGEPDLLFIDPGGGGERMQHDDLSGRR